LGGDLRFGRKPFPLEFDLLSRCFAHNEGQADLFRRWLLLDSAVDSSRLERFAADASCLLYYKVAGESAAWERELAHPDSLSGTIPLHSCTSAPRSSPVDKPQQPQDLLLDQQYDDAQASGDGCPSRQNARPGMVASSSTGPNTVKSRTNWSGNGCVSAWTAPLQYQMTGKVCLFLLFCPPALGETD